MATAATHATAHRLILLATIILVGAAIVRTREVRSTGEAGVARSLPDRVGAWTGDNVYFCQTATCQWTVTSTELGDTTACPKCGGELSSGSRVELSILPKDTDIIRKLYVGPGGMQLVATIVLSGADRTSIHRPQICLVGGGQEIVASDRRTVTRADGGSFDMMVLSLLWRGRDETGRTATRERFFAYWFAGPDHVTPSHLARMFWMGFERIFLGITHRWAYISINGTPTPGSDAHLRALDEFARDFYPQVVMRTTAPPPAAE